MSNNDSDKAGFGCIIVFLLIFLVPMLVELVRALAVLAIIGGVGYGIYWLNQYDKKTGNISEFFAHNFNIGTPRDTLDLPDNQDDSYGLPQADEQENILQQITQLNEKVKVLEQENRQLKDGREQDIHKALDHYAEKIDKKNKKQLLKGFFGNEDEEDDYSRADEFEKQKFQDGIKKKTEDLEIREIKQDMNEQLFEQEKMIFDFRDEAKDDRQEIRNEMRDGFANVDNRFLHLEKEITTFKGFVVEKFAYIETTFFKEISNVKDTISRLRVEIKEEISDVRVQFGKEIVRLDQQQLKIVGKLQEYENKLKSFSIEVMHIKNEAERFAIRGEDTLNKANNMYHRHRTDMKLMSKDLTMGLQQMSLHKADFANKVGQAKLLMDSISQDQYLALKDMAYERIGINMLRQDYTQRTNLENQKMHNLIQEKRHIEEKIQEKLSRGQEVAGLKHQLYMTEENLRYTSNRANLMQQESAMILRLSK